MRSFVLGFLAVTAAACAGTDADPGVQPAEPPPCRPGRGAPVTERALKEAFAAEGIRLYRDDDCFDSVLAVLSNITDAVPGEREEAILSSQGHIFCEVYDSGASTRIERFVWRYDPHPTYVRVLNVDCGIYPETIRQTDAVERALRRLPGVSRLPSTVPSADAVRD